MIYLAGANTYNRAISSIKNFTSRLLNGTLGIGEIMVLSMLLITSCIIRFYIPYALLWDSIIGLFLILLYKSMQRFIKHYGGLEFLGKHSFNIFLFHTFIYYLYFPFLIYWSRNPIIIFISLLISSIVVSIGIEKLKNMIGFYKLQNWLMQKKENPYKSNLFKPKAESL